MILKRSNAVNHRLVNIIEDLKDGFCTITLDGEFIYYNRAAAELINLVQDSSVNFFKEIVGNESQVLYIKNYLSNNEFLKDYEVNLNTTNKRSFPAIISLTKIKDLSSHDIGISVLIKDMTYLKKVQQQLLQAQKMESIGMLASGIAHEFNNILTGIIPNAELIKLTTNGDDSNHSRAKSIEISATRAADIVKKLLNFARDDKKTDDKFINLNKTVRETLDILRKLFDRNIEIVDNLIDGLYRVKIDETSLQQIIMNLAINAKDAIKYKGKIIFSAENYGILNQQPVEMNHIDKQIKYVRLEVRDTGCGISAENLRYIFNPFFTTKKPGEGTGLGLSMVYGIVKSVNGSIEVNSILNKGTTFTIFIPGTEIEDAEESINTKINKIGQDRTVLVIDDESIIVDIASDMLKALGFKVLSATSGSNGLKIFKQYVEKIDLVILDLLMPEMNGATCFENLKLINPKVRVIISSGVGEMEKRNQLNKMGISDYLEKPYNLHKMAEKIYNIIN